MGKMRKRKEDKRKFGTPEGTCNSDIQIKCPPGGGHSGLGCARAEKLIGVVFLAALIGLLTFICVQNCIKLEVYVNDDMGGEFLYMRKVAETKNPFTPAYANSSELFFSRAWFIYAIFYWITGKVILSAKMTLVVTTVLVCLSALLFFYKMRWSWPAVFVAAASFFGLISKDLSEVLFYYFNAYCMFYIGIFITFGLYMDIIRDEKFCAWKYGILCFVALYFGLSGPRMLIYLYFPILVVELLRKIFARLNGDKLSWRGTVYASGLMLVDLVGKRICDHVLIPYMKTGAVYRPRWVSYGEIFEDIRKEISCFLQACGIELSGKLLSDTHGFLTLYILILLAILVLMLRYIFVKCKSETVITLEERMILSSLLISGGALLFYSIFMSFSGTMRYWVIVPILVALSIGIVYRYFQRRTDLKTICYLFCAFILFGICLSSVAKYGEKVSEPTPKMQLTSWLEDNNIQRVAGHYWSVNSVVFLSDGQISGMLLSDSEDLMIRDWITDRTKFANDDEPVTLILTAAQKNSYESSETKSQLLSLCDSPTVVSGYYIYNFDKNPFAFNLLEFGEDARFNFLNLSHNENAFLEGGEIILRNGGIQYGPNISLSAGTYDVVIRGDNLTCGTFDVVSNATNEALLRTYEPQEFVAKTAEITFSIELENNDKRIEFRCFNNSDETVVIDDITIIPRGIKPIWE